MDLLDVQPIRRANLLLLLKECGDGRGAQAKLSRLTGVKSPFISQLKKAGTLHSGGAERTMGDDTARALERGMDKPFGWMDHDHSDAPDGAKQLYSISQTLTPTQIQVLIQTAEAFRESNGKPPPDDGPEIRQPRPTRKH